MANTVQKTTVYIPDKAIKQGFFSLLREIVSETAASGWLTYQLFRKNFISTYRQSILGVFWAILVPVVAIGTIIYLNAGGLFNIGDISLPYPIFAVAGLALWQLFAVGLTLGTNALVGAGAMITKIHFPRESLVFSGIAQGCIPSLIQIVIVFILFAVYRIVPPWTVLLVPLAVIPLLLLTVGLGFILSLINGVVRDAVNGITVLLTFFLFVTPILYAKPSSGIVDLISRYNPLYYLVSVPRDLLITGTVSDLKGYFYSSALSLAVFLICWVAFHLSETKIAERI